MQIERYSHSQLTGFSPNRFGFELEVEVKERRNRQTVADKFDQLLKIGHTAENQPVHLKEDSSLRYGFEIVSKPLPMAELKQLLCQVAKIGRSTRALDSWDSPRCGFHFHIGAEHFENALQLTRFLWVFQALYIVDLFLIPVAGRKPNRWARRLPRGVKLSYRDAFAHKIQFTLPSRYFAVNLENPHTIEVRLFRGSLQDATLLRYVELIELLLGFSKQPCSSTRTLGRQLRRYYLDNKASFPNLDSFLVKNNIWPYRAAVETPLMTDTQTGGV